MRRNNVQFNLGNVRIRFAFVPSASSNPEVIRINSVVDVPAKVEAYYLRGYVVGALHPVLHPAGPRGALPASHLYRAVLLRPKAR